MIRNIRHIQIKKIAHSPRLFQAILTYEEPNNQHDESDDIEYTKYLENRKTDCPHCIEMAKRRRSIDRCERE